MGQKQRTKSTDMKKFHKMLAKTDNFKDVKFRVEAACGKFFVVYSGKVEILNGDFDE